MVVNVRGNTVEMTAQGDEFLVPTVAQSVRFVASAATQVGDLIELTDPVNGGVLWKSNASVAGVGSEAELIHSGSRSSRTWPNGFRLNVLTGDRGDVYVRLA